MIYHLYCCNRAMPMATTVSHNWSICVLPKSCTYTHTENFCGMAKSGTMVLNCGFKCRAACMYLFSHIRSHHYRRECNGLQTLDFALGSTAQLHFL